MDVDLTLFFIVVAVVSFLIGLSKGGLGGTLGAVSTPLLALVMPVDQVIGLVLPILMIGDVFAVSLHWGNWDRRLVLLLLPGSLLGVIIGTLFITNAPTRTLRIALGIIVLLFAIYKLFEERIVRSLPYGKRDWHGLLAGALTGFSSALAHTGGPVIGVYLLLQDTTPAAFIATSALFFTILNWIKVPFYFGAGLFDFAQLLQIAWLIPLVPLGVWIGKKVATRVSKQTFDRAITGLLGITAVLLILT